MNKRGFPKTHSMPNVFVFFLIGLFAATSLTLTLIGMRVYREVTVNATQNSSSQMMLHYLSNKIHTFDAVDSIAIEYRNGLDVLCLYETLDGQRYETAIYAYQGSVMELFTQTGIPFQPENGERLMEARSLTFMMPSPQLIEAKVVMPYGAAHTLRMALRTHAIGEAN